MPRQSTAIEQSTPRPRADWALFLDLDGTVLDIAATARTVAVPRGLGATLARLQSALRGALAILSGRKIADIDRLLSPLRLPAAGQHGAELRIDPARPVECAGAAAPPAEWRDRLGALARAHAGIIVEDKGLTLAVHYRNVPAAEARVREELDALAARDRRFAVQAGKYVLELRPRDSDKGAALRRFMSTAPFAGRTPIVLGDDVTDEAAFAAAATLGGQGLRVGPQSESPGHAFADPQAVRDWLAHCAKALARGEARA